MDQSAMVEEVRAALAKYPGFSPGSYSDEVKAVTARHARALRAAGLPWSQVLAGLPMSSTAVRAWMEREDGQRAGDAGPLVTQLRPVEVLHRAASEGKSSHSEASRTGAVLTTPRGFRVEGLHVGELLELLVVLG